MSFADRGPFPLDWGRSPRLLSTTVVPSEFGEPPLSGLDSDDESPKGGEGKKDLHACPPSEKVEKTPSTQFPFRTREREGPPKTRHSSPSEEGGGSPEVGMRTRRGDGERDGTSEDVGEPRGTERDGGAEGSEECHWRMARGEVLSGLDKQGFKVWNALQGSVWGGP